MTEKIQARIDWLTAQALDTNTRGVTHEQKFEIFMESVKGSPPSREECDALIAALQDKVSTAQHESIARILDESAGQDTAIRREIRAAQRRASVQARTALPRLKTESYIQSF